MTANRIAPIDDDSQTLPAYWLFVVGQMTEDDVLQIADGDVGHDFHGHLSGIRTLMESTDTAEFCLEWCPQEALGLYRWHDVEHEPLAKRAVERRRVIFCVTALLIAATVPENSGRIFSINENLATLISCHLALGLRYDDSLDEFLAWLERALLPEFSDELAFLYLARGIVAIGKSQPCPDDAACFFHRSFAAAWQQRRNSLEMCGGNARPWFWFLKITVFDQRDFIWRSMLDQALAVSSVNGWESCVAELTKLKSVEEYP